MIIVRSPLRISLGGGGTDLPSYYRQFGGFLTAGAIDKYVYIALNQTFTQKLLLRYSQLEEVKEPEEARHPIFREALKLLGFSHPYLDIAAIADIPAGTGLGSSGSFTTALLKALHTYKKQLIHPRELAEEACRIELDILKEPIGKQDQYIAAFGGITSFEFHRDGSVTAAPANLKEDILYDLEENLLLFFTGYSRSAAAILKEQDDKSKENSNSMIENLHFIKELGFQSKEALETGNLEEFARIMNVHWQYKKQRSSAMSNFHINEWYEIARANGAVGGKLIGAGGGGFLMLYASEKARLRKAMKKSGLQEVHFKFDFEGTKVIVTY